MNVFVLCTGRCGSSTFSKACEHIDNYTVGHETNIGRLGTNRLVYPRDHIEVDNRLSWFLGRLDQSYGAKAFYVHLIRDRAATVASFEKRGAFGIMRAYRDGIYLGMPETCTPQQVAEDYYSTVNANIEYFLRGKENSVRVRIEQMEEDFVAFWNAVRANGSLVGALSEWRKRYNASR